LCFPVILFSHASNSGFPAAPEVADRGVATAADGAARPPRPKAAAPAARRPRNPRRCVVSLVRSNMICLLSMRLAVTAYGDVLRRAACVGYATSGGASPFGQSWILSGKSGRGCPLT